MPPLTPQSCRRYAVITLLVVAIAALVDYLLVMNAHLKYHIPPTGGKPPNPEDYHVDLPYDDEDESTHRLDISDLGNTNTVMCRPIVGSIIVARSLTAVELDFLSLPRFSLVPRLDKLNATAEDAFCRRLRLLGAKWYSNHWDYLGAHEMQLRRLTPYERETLHLGWPETGGLWLMRQKNELDLWPWMWRMRNAYTMEERGTALEMAGATFYKNPDETEYVKPLFERG
jgi:hypothetical protein